MTQSKRALIIFPTYNEKDNIEKIVHAVLPLDARINILIVDDNSPDGTGQIADRLAASEEKVNVLHRQNKEGLGKAYIAGFKWAIENGYDFIFEMDADFSHRPADLDRLYTACKYEGADMAIGSRYVKGGGTVNWPWDRNLLSRGGSLYTRLITWMPVHDTTAGFVCYRREVLETINLDEITFLGYAFQIEMKFAAWKLGFRIREVPIIFEDRKYGISKMHKGIVKEGILGVLKLRWHSLFKDYRRRVKNSSTVMPALSEDDVLARSKA